MKPLSESVIKAHIVQWLRLQKNCFVWVNTSVGVWDEKKKLYRRMNGIGQMKGTADILGVWQGRPLAIEVKAARGVLSEHQAVFLLKFQDAGGISICARSVDDVIISLKNESQRQSARAASNPQPDKTPRTTPILP